MSSLESSIMYGLTLNPLPYFSLQSWYPLQPCLSWWLSSWSLNPWANTFIIIMNFIIFIISSFSSALLTRLLTSLSMTLKGGRSSSGASSSMHLATAFFMLRVWSFIFSSPQQTLHSLGLSPVHEDLPVLVRLDTQLHQHQHCADNPH